MPDGRNRVRSVAAPAASVYGELELQGMRMAMSRDRHGMVDLLEIYHARSLRNLLVRELARLDSQDSVPPGHDPARRAEIREFYESMLITSGGLLYSLGDLPD
jgi:hypothetical protein